MNPIEWLNSVQLLQPWALLVAPLLITAGLLALLRQQGGKVWQRLFDAELLPRFLVAADNSQVSRQAVVLVVLVSLLLALALAQPVWRKLPQPVYQQQSALVIALDLSRSMLAEDVAPSRLQQARFRIRDLLAQRREGQTALLVYAGDAFTVTPLTDDTDTIISQLNALEPDIMPVQGSRPARAVALANQLLSGAGINGGDILLLGDALNGEGLVYALDNAAKDGRRVSVLALGSAEGAPVPGLKYRDGRPVIAPVDFPQMAQSRRGGGLAVQAQLDASDVARLTALFAEPVGDVVTKAHTLPGDQWVADGRWLILLALPLLLPLFRRGLLSLTLAMLITAPLLLSPAPVMAASEVTADVEPDGINWQQQWHSLWQRPDQQAQQQWHAGDRAGAAQRFERQDWQQAAHYDQGNYQQAIDSLQTPETSDQWYNRANALAKQGRFDEALQAYDQALQLNPDNRDATANRQQVAAAKKQLEQQSSQQSSQQQGSQQQGSQQQSPQQSEQQQGQSGQQDKNDGQQNEPGSSSPPSQPEQSAQRNASQNPSSEKGDSQQPLASDTSGGPDDQAQQHFSQALDQAADQEPFPQDEAGVVAGMPQQQPMDEKAQARQQLLNRVIDDPAGLWRRKFLYQYRQQAEPLPQGEQPW
ncbi:MAG: VWA domain-containing protein [Marinobacterium sp.]|nr:VWA domain-containing protein [Marinobacterium sp.]